MADLPPDQHQSSASSNEIVAGHVQQHSMNHHSIFQVDVSRRQQKILRSTCDTDKITKRNKAHDYVCDDLEVSEYTTHRSACM